MLFIAVWSLVFVGCLALPAHTISEIYDANVRKVQNQNLNIPFKADCVDIIRYDQLI